MIVDEVHAVAGTKRGAHLAISLERLERLVEQPFQRIGLSATQRPLEEIGRFVSGDRPIELVDAGVRKELDLEVVIPVEDLRELGASPERVSSRSCRTASRWTPATRPTRARSGRRSTRALLELVRAHRSTIVFVNNRRLAERLALRLNELAEAEVARAHHGSLAREQRVEIEELLKAGEIPCLVATSSLELGIDMGAVDLVVQVESPKSIARGLQRIGRAGHELGAVSKGRIFPKFRGDLLESAVVAKAMREGAIEETTIPQEPARRARRSRSWRSAPTRRSRWATCTSSSAAPTPSPTSRAPQLENVLDMLAGRYPSDEFAELKPRIVWDRTAGVIRGREGARRLAVTNAGTIPDRGLFGVHLVDGGGRVGELDEEMVYEARQGQTFLLGASSWRIEEITRDRVIVSPAPGVPGAVPFWKGEGVGRPFELGERVGRASRELVGLSDAKALATLRTDYDLDDFAARNLLTYLRDQAEATGTVASAWSRGCVSRLRAREVVEVVVRSQGRQRLRIAQARRSREARPSRSPSSNGLPTPSPFQKGTAPGTPGAGETITRSRVISSIRQLDAPSRKVCPGALRRPSPGQAPRRPVDEVDAEEAAVGNRARVRHRQAPRPSPPADHACRTVPDDPRLQLGEFVGQGRGRRACRARSRAAGARSEKGKAPREETAPTSISWSAQIATICCASTSSGFLGIVVSSIAPSRIAFATTADSSRSPRNLGKIRPFETAPSRRRGRSAAGRALSGSRPGRRGRPRPCRSRARDSRWRRGTDLAGLEQLLDLEPLLARHEP